MSFNPPFKDSCAKGNSTSLLYTNSSAGLAYSAGVGAFGAPALSINGGWPAATIIFAAAQNEWLLNGYWSIDSIPGSTITLFTWKNGSTTQASITLNTSAELQFAVNGTLVGPVSAPISAGQIYNWQWKYIIAASGGLLELYVNAGNPLDGGLTPFLQFTGNTTNGAALVNQLQFNSVNLAGDASQHWSHILVYDGVDSGDGTPFDYVGPKTVILASAVADSLTPGLNQMSTSPSQTAGNHHININHTSNLGDTQYNFGATPGLRESYVLASVPSGTHGIIGVCPFALARIDDAGPHTDQIGLRYASTDQFVSTVFSPSASYSYQLGWSSLNPVTNSAWIAPDITNTESQVKIIT